VTSSWFLIPQQDGICLLRVTSWLTNYSSG